jgi:hypothetical protein
LNFSHSSGVTSYSGKDNCPPMRRQKWA